MIGAPVILVAGTFALDPEALEGLLRDRQFDHLPWWHPASPFGRASVAHGTIVVAEPFIWSTALDGVIGFNTGWYSAGAALRYFARYVTPRTPISLIVHSHAGQIAAYAAAQGLEIDVLVTLGTPVRCDMQPTRRAARPRIRRWVHVYSPNDPVQLEGEQLDGGGIFSWPRQMPEADENVEEPTEEPDAHGKLHDPALWTARGWWRWLTE